MPMQAADQTTRISASGRQRIEHAIEAHLDAVMALTELLDRTEGDCDLEDGSDDEDGGDDEPSLGSSESREGGTIWHPDHSGIYAIDLEIDAGDCCELEADDENWRQPPMLDGLEVKEIDDSVRRPPSYMGCASPIFPDRR